MYTLNNVQINKGSHTASKCIKELVENKVSFIYKKHGNTNEIPN